MLIGLVRAQDQPGLRCSAPPTVPLHQLIKECTALIGRTSWADERWINLIARSWIWREAGDFDKQIADLTTGLEFAGKKRSMAEGYWLATRANLLHQRSGAWLAKGEINRALEDITTAIALRPRRRDLLISRGNANVIAGKLEDAISDYSNAIQIESSDFAASIYALRSIPRYYRNDFAQALTDIQSAAKYRSAQYPFSGFGHEPLWADVVRQRNNAASTLSQEIRLLELRSGQWPEALYSLYLGKTSLAAVMAETVDLGDFRGADRQRITMLALGRTCLTNFYSGHWSLRQGNKAEAARLFQSAAESCPRYLVEGAMARLELNMIGGTQIPNIQKEYPERETDKSSSSTR